MRARRARTAESAQFTDILGPFVREETTVVNCNVKSAITDGPEQLKDKSVTEGRGSIAAKGGPCSKARSANTTTIKVQAGGQQSCGAIRVVPRVQE